ncbi:MAG: hypothetical protein JXB39_00360, partial [Deltaproteobacteria bacterium]|nr:hypothetical protein [Deltaproteobacteria bacterium]
MSPKRTPRTVLARHLADQMAARERSEVRATPVRHGRNLERTPTKRAVEAKTPGRTKPLAKPVQAMAEERTSKLDAYADKVGVLVDQEVADMAGVARSTVVLYRQTRGIPPAPRRKAAPQAVEAPAPVELPKPPAPVESTEPPAPVESPVEPVNREPAPIVFLEAPVPVRKPAPVKPAPVEAAPVEPAPVEPAPVKPAPVKPAPVEPAPVKPAPVEVAPVEAAPVEAAPFAFKKRGRPSRMGQFLDKIGVLNDDELAALAGVSRTTARNWRQAKSLPVPQREGSKARAPVVQTSRIEPFLDKIGEVPDSEVAALAGVTRAAVQDYRRRRGILSASEKMRQASPASPVKVVRKSKLEPFADEIGVLPDAEVAALAGLTPGAVAYWRNQRGIPAPRTLKRAGIARSEAPTLPVAEREPPEAIEATLQPVASEPAIVQEETPVE